MEEQQFGQQVRGRWTESLEAVDDGGGILTDNEGAERVALELPRSIDRERRESRTRCQIDGPPSHKLQASHGR
jgi:hypothetical protein